MTDEELAAKLEWHAKHCAPTPGLLENASERLYALSAHVALLKASLARAEREAEKPTASADPVAWAAWIDGSDPAKDRPQLSIEEPRAYALRRPLCFAHRPTEDAVREACEILQRIKGAHSSWGGWSGTPSHCDAAINLLSYRDSSDAAPQPVAREVGIPESEPAIAAFNCWSSDGECWYPHPADACILDDVFSGSAPKVGDEYEVFAGWRSVEARYRFTFVDEYGDVEVECISHAREAAPQPDRVAELERDLRRATESNQANIGELKRLKERLEEALVKTHARFNGEECWIWQGNADHLETLTCPVVIRPEALAELTAEVKRLRGGIQKLMGRLSFLLDEDHFAECEQIVKVCGVSPQFRDEQAGHVPVLMAAAEIECLDRAAGKEARE